MAGSFYRLVSLLRIKLYNTYLLVFIMEMCTLTATGIFSSCSLWFHDPGDFPVEWKHVGQM
jgi:hypothetical protein